jgi:hypothetical protein
MNDFHFTDDDKTIDYTEEALVEGSQERSTEPKKKGRGRPKSDPAKKKAQKTITVDQATIDAHKSIRKDGDIIDFSSAARAGIRMLQDATQEERRRIFDELDISYE